MNEQNSQDKTDILKSDTIICEQKGKKSTQIGGWINTYCLSD